MMLGRVGPGLWQCKAKVAVAWWTRAPRPPGVFLLPLQRLAPAQRPLGRLPGRVAAEPTTGGDESQGLRGASGYGGTRMHFNLAPNPSV